MTNSDSSQSFGNEFSERTIQPESQDVPVPSRAAPPKITKQQLRYVVLDCLDAGKTRQEIREKLIDYAYSEIDADKFTEIVEKEQRQTREYDDEFRGDAPFFKVVGVGTGLVGISIAAGCISAASYDHDLAANPLWVTGMVLAAAVTFIGTRLFWRGLWQ